MNGFSEVQRAELRDAFARSRLAAQEQSRLRVDAAANEARLARLADKKAAPRTAMPTVPPVHAKTEMPALPVPKRRDPILDLPEAQPVIARLLSAIGDENAIDAEAHILRIAADVVRAKKQPRNPYAEATL